MNKKGGNAAPALDHNGIIGDNIDFNPTPILNLFNYCKEIFLFGADYYSERISNKNDGSWFIWDKHCMEKDTTSVFGSEFETCWSKKKHRREIVKIQWIGAFGGVKDDTNAQKRKHPTQKPVQLSEWFINKFSKEESFIMDGFGGSGSTLIACQKTNRKCFMMELDPKYVDVIVSRFCKFKGTNQIKRNGETITWVV